MIICKMIECYRIDFKDNLFWHMTCSYNHTQDGGNV